MPECEKCRDAGFLPIGETKYMGPDDADIPCGCEIGKGTMFNVEGVEGEVTGEEILRHFLPDSPEHIKLSKETPIQASSLPGRKKKKNKAKS